MAEMFRNHAPASGADVESEAQQHQSQERENQLQTSPIHNDNNSDNIHENDDHRSTMHLNRVSPYTSTRTAIEEISTIDDQTIDAAVVEEIVEAVAGTPIPPLPLPMNAANVRAEAELLPVVPNHLQHHATLPEVEPEIDIEEVHVVHHPPGGNMSMISALSANTASIEQQQDTKLPPPTSGSPYIASTPTAAAFGGGTNFGQHQQQQQYQQYQQYQQRQNLPYPPISTPAGAAVPPPPMPRQVPITDYRGYSAGTASTNTPPVFKPPSIPIFTSVMMSSGRQISNNDMTAGNYSSSSNEQQQSCDDLPDYKDQARPMIPSGVPINTSRNTSNNSGGTTDSTANWNHTINANGNSDGSGQNSSQRNNNNTNSDNDQEHIPVVAAILVPAERLAAEERLEEQWMQQQQQQQRNYQAPHGGEPIGTESSHRQSNSNMSSGESTLTSSDTSRNNNNGDQSNGNNNHPEQHSNSNNTQRSKDTTTSDELNSNSPKNSPMSERRFWITMIMAALLLNSLLVGGAVVGGFCAAGKCSSSSSSNKSNTVSSVDLPPLTNAPIPTVIRTTAPVPTTNIPTPAPSAHDRSLSQIPSVLSSGPTKGKFESFPVAAEAPASSPAFESVLVSPFPTPGQVPLGIGSTTDDSLTDGMPPTDDMLIDEEPDDNIGNGGTAAPSQNMNVTVDTTIMGTLPPTFAPLPKNITTDERNETGSGLPNTGPSAPDTDDGMSAEDDDGGRNMKFAIFIPILVAVETIIIIGLVLYYRYWKKQRQKYLLTDSDSCKTSPTTMSTTISPTVIAVNGTTSATNEGEQQQQSFSSSTGDTSSGSSSSSSGSNNSHDDRGNGVVCGSQQERVLSTIEECNSSCDQYSV